MHKFLITGVLLLISIISLAQSDNHDLLDRYTKGDSTLSDFEVMELIFKYRDLSKINKNDGLLESIQQLEQDSLYEEIENQCAKILTENPLNFMASFYYSLALLRQKKSENLESLQAFSNKITMMYGTLNRFGRGTAQEPYYVVDLNDAKAMIALFWEQGTRIDSTSNTLDNYFNLHITTPKGESNTICFDFSEQTSIREVFFDYHRDFLFYLTESSKPESQYYYDALLQRFQNEDQSIKNNEVIAMLIGFTNNQHYDPYENTDRERAIMASISDKEYERALIQCQEFLKTNPLNFTALMEEGFALRKLNNDRNLFPSVKSKILTNAIVWSGTGSYNHPYFVLSPIDGQTLIQYVFGKNIGTMGSGYDSNGYFLDILNMKTEKETITLHFNINHAIKNSILIQQIDKALNK